MVIAAALLLVAAAPAADTAPPAAAPEPIAAMVPPPESADTPVFQVIIEQQLIIRVPAQRSQLNNFAASPGEAPRVRRQVPIVWKEKNAPKCVAMRNIVGMQAVQRDSIDLITRQRERLRAQLNRGCRALDFYAGFYMKGSKDGKLCEDRDEIHARTGAKCEVDKFRLMVAVRDDD